MLINLLPYFFKESNEVIELQGAFNNQMEMVIAAKEDYFKQFILSTATWGLENWERAYGLEIDISKSNEFRRTRIMSKMRGQGTTTKGMIENVAKSFSNGEVEVIEHADNYTFEIKFVGTMGIPPNMGDLTSAIEEIKPTHLAYSYTYIYRTYEELKPFTHNQLNNYTHEDLREGVIN